MIIFDLDGTIVDTLDDLMIAVNFALAKFNFPLRTRENIRLDIGNGTIKLIKRSAPKGTSPDILKQIHAVFKEFYIRNIGDATRPYDGITSLLISLKTAGYKLAVVSNKDHEPTLDIVNKYFRGLFDYIQGSYMDHPKKPDPYLINKVISESGIDKSEITYIGDTNVDEESAKNAGLDYILVSYGYRTKQELLSQVKTKRIVDSISQIEFMLKR